MRILLILGIPLLAVLTAVALTGQRQEPPKKERVELDPLSDVVILEPIMTHFDRL